MTKTLISIVGPTAIGKTALSLSLARYFNTEIISADSRQFYKEMCIGTAVPEAEELDTIKHHFIQHKSIHESYNVGDFETDAITALTEIHATRPIAIMVGGSGLYVKAVSTGLDNFPKVDHDVREALHAKLKLNGLKYLQEQLKYLDLKAYQTIAIENPQRLIRALEICIGTGKPYTSFLTHTNKPRPFKTITIGLNAERSIIYDRINSRVDHMMASGLLDEVKSLKSFKQLNALNTVGYKELFDYLEGNCSLDFAVSEIKKHTRRFAKRQLTWFKKHENTHWFDYNTKAQNIIAFITSK